MHFARRTNKILNAILNQAIELKSSARRGLVVRRKAGECSHTWGGYSRS